MQGMMESPPTPVDNECSSSDQDVTMATAKTLVQLHTEVSKNNVLDVTSTSEIEEIDDSNMAIDMTMNRASASSPSPPSSPPTFNNTINNDNDNIQSPDECEELTIDEKCTSVDDQDSVEVKATPMELESVEIDDSNRVVSCSSSEDALQVVGPSSPPCTSARHLSPPSSPANEIQEINSPSNHGDDDDDDEGDLQIDENEKLEDKETDIPEAVVITSEVEAGTKAPVVEEEEQGTTEEITEPEMPEQTPIQMPDSEVVEDRLDKSIDEDSQISAISAEEIDLNKGASTTEDNNDKIESTAETAMSPEPEERIPEDLQDPDSPLSQIQSGAFDDSFDSGRSPISIESNSRNGILLQEDSISETSFSESACQVKKERPAKAPKLVDLDEEDLEDGEIMDEEEEDEEMGEKPSKTQHKSEVVTKKKEKSDKKEKSKSSDKPKENEKEELDPVKRLLAEVKERDKSEKDKEREKRRRDKKRSKQQDKDDKDKSEPNSKKKKRKMSEDEDDGEEFLLVRGASPSGDIVDLTWDEFGDERRNKRRRDSEDSGSPHRHHRGLEGSMSPGSRTRPGSNRPPKTTRPKEPKSEVICAYFMQGKCQKSSEDCTFSHDAVPPRKMELCKFWMMECCAKKEKCLYLHNDFPCKFFHTGLVCRMAERCKFSHKPLNEVTKQVLLKHIETAPKEILGDFPRLNRAGAINLINKQEAKMNGLPYREDSPVQEDVRMDQGPPQHGHGGHGHGPPQHGYQDRHSHGHGGHGHENRSRGHYGQNQNHHDGGRGRGGDRGDRQGSGGGGNNINNNNNQDHNSRRQSRWEQTQPTRDDQEKLQELMDEAGISGFYKDTLEQGGGPPPPQHMQNIPTSQSQMFPPQLQNMQPPLLPLLPQFLPNMLPQNNPTLANVFASLNLPNPSTMTQFQPGLLDTPPPPILLSQPPPKVASPEPTTTPPPVETKSSVPEHLPKMQRELFLRIQQQQLKNENKVQTEEKQEPEEQEENWYSDDEEEDSKKKEELKAEINDQISSVLSQIRQQSQQQQQTNVSKDTDSLKTFFGDTDLRASTPSASDFKDVDLRTTNIFKKIDILPATEINASLSAHGPMVYRAIVVAGLREKPDYSAVRQTLPASTILMDPRLGPKRSNSIPAPESPTDSAADNATNQPMSIPDGTPVFDPRTSRSGGSNTSQPSRGNESSNHNMFPDRDNRFDNSLMGMNDYSNPFNRDPRAPTGNQQNQQQQQQQQHQQQANQAAANNAAAQNLALAAAAAAMMQQQYGQAPIDPNLFMLGFPFLPPVTQGQNQPPPMNFDGIMGAAPPGLRMRPPFMQQHQQQQQPPASSWERFSQGQQGQGNMSPPL